MTVVHIGAKPLGAQGDSKGYHVNYLERSATLAYPNVKLVSTDGSAVVKLNSALLASASNTLRYYIANMIANMNGLKKKFDKYSTKSTFFV